MDFVLGPEGAVWGQFFGGGTRGQASRAVGSLLKKGDWLRAKYVFTWQNAYREVPVPLFQPLKGA
jgi:hypothetical protein